MPTCATCSRSGAADGDLVHLLFDDDLLYPDFYERHLTAHRSGNFTCAVSRRWTAIESGQPVARPQVPPELTSHPSRLIAVGPDLIYPSTIPFCRNWLGEFSNSVWRADMREAMERAELNGLSYEGLEDMGMFLTASERGTVCFINEALGAFRHGPEQNTSQLLAPVMMKAHLAWVALAIAARRGGRLDASQARDGIVHLQSLVDRALRQRRRPWTSSAASSPAWWRGGTARKRPSCMRGSSSCARIEAWHPAPESRRRLSTALTARPASSGAAAAPAARTRWPPGTCSPSTPPPAAPSGSPSAR